MLTAVRLEKAAHSLQLLNNLLVIGDGSQSLIPGFLQVTQLLLQRSDFFSQRCNLAEKKNASFNTISDLGNFHLDTQGTQTNLLLLLSFRFALMQLRK